MRRKHRILFAGLLLVAFSGCIWLVLRPHEPVYQGKPLTFWLDQYGSNHWTLPNGDPDKQAQTAIQQIGTNAIPIYLQLMTIRASPLKLKMIALVPKPWQARLHMPDALAYQNELHRNRGLGAFGIVALGPDAKPVVPTLQALLNDKDPDVRDNGVFALRSLGPVASEALPSLIECLKDPDPGVRSDAILSLGEIHRKPEQVIPILIGYLDSRDPSLRVGALWSLIQFGAEAKPAVPSLLKLLNDTDETVRAEAANALRVIDPETATNSGVK